MISYGVPRGWRRDAPEEQLAAALSLLPSPLCDFERQMPYVPGRKFAADFGWVAQRLLVEVQGGIFTGQAHGSITGIMRDNERLLYATLHGWRLLRFAPDSLSADRIGGPLEVIEAILRTEFGGDASKFIRGVVEI